MSKNRREVLIKTILSKNGDEDNLEERMFLEALTIPELGALAISNDDELEET